jgi:hypothetical protein
MIRTVKNSSIATLKSIAVTFVVAGVFYLIAWKWISQRQTGKGPWQVQFTTNTVGTPQIVINQPALGISNVTVRFEQETLAATNKTGLVLFLKPRMATPFGRVAYDDLMFQPGSVAIDAFGHVVEMLPRTLGLNANPTDWRSGAEFVLYPTNKVPEAERKKWKGGYR